MRIFCNTDQHVCTYCSILRSRGEQYSTRLENIINSLNWVEEMAEKLQCNLVLGLGDFFDKSELTSEELTALREIKWNNLSHGFLVGNHEIGRGNRAFSSAHIFSLVPNVKIFDKPEIFDIGNNTELAFLPYILEVDRKPLEEYFPKTTKKRYIFSHNDIAGIQMGMFMSKSGFSIEEIEDNCDLFLNGHLHNGTEITKKIINLGNLTGQNFSEDASKYSHKACLVDTETGEITYYENPYALNFYKIDLTTSKFDFNSFKPNSIVSVKVDEDNVNSIKELIDNNKNIIESRILISKKSGNISEMEDTTTELNSSDHLKMFQEFILNNIGNDDITLSELEKIIGG